MKLISVMIPCYNEEANIEEMYLRITKIFQDLPQYNYELIIPDNCSTDNTPNILRSLASKDAHVKVLLNARNFGVERSCTNAFLQCSGDAVIQIASDFQDPPEMILEFIHYWEQGFKIVLGQKCSTKDSWIIGTCRKIYYRMMNYLADNGHINNVTGFGLYDKDVMDILRWMEDPLPYTRGIICDLGIEIKLIPYNKLQRQKGKSSYNIKTYLDTAIWAITNTSKKPLRCILGLSIILLLLSILIIIFACAAGYVYQNNLWIILPVIFAMTSLIIFSIGIVGEYVGLIVTKITKRPLTVTKEKINFNDEDSHTIITDKKMYGQ